MGEFDKTKKAIGIGKMDDKDREQMFNKFKSAGGEVVKDKKPEEDPSQKNRSKNRPSTGSSGKGTGGSVARRSSGTTSNRSKQSETSSPYILPSGKKEKSQQEIEAQMGNFLNRLIIKFKCWAGKVTSFGNSDLLAEFISELNLECKNSLLEMKMAGLDIMADPGVGKKIATELDKINPLYIELIGKAHKLYDSSEFESISGTYNSNQNFSVPIDRAAPSVYSLYRKIYYLYSFQGTYRKGIILAYDLLQKIEKKPAIIYTTKKKRISAAINTIFDRMFPKLYLVILRNESKNIPMVSFYMENLLGIIDEEKPGKRKPGDPLPISSNEEEIENVEEGEEEEEVEENEEDFSSVPSELKLGLKFMSEQTVEDLKQKYDPRNELNIIPKNDKAMIAYLYFREFDYEYSFVLTTKKIQYKVTTDTNSKKIDNRQILLDIYELSRACMDQFRIYQDVIEEIGKNRDNPSANYIDASKKATQMEQKRIQQSRNLRNSIKEYTENTRNALKTVLDDLRGSRNIVGNPDELMVFDAIESKKRFHRLPIKECILNTYAYSYALSERLNHGDLYGGVVELSPEEMTVINDFNIPVKEGELDMENLLGSNKQSNSID